MPDLLDIVVLNGSPQRVCWKVASMVQMLLKHHDRIAETEVGVIKFRHNGSRVNAELGVSMPPEVDKRK